MSAAFKERFLLCDEHIKLRTLRPTDVQKQYLQWMCDPEVSRYSEWSLSPHSLQSLRSLCGRDVEESECALCSVYLVKSNRYIGNIKLNVDPHHRTADIGILLGEEDCWGKGYATAAIKLLSDYALEALEVRKLWAGAYRLNSGAIRAFEKAGFKIEARMERHFLAAEGEVDGFIFRPVQVQRRASQV